MILNAMMTVTTKVKVVMLTVMITMMILLLNVMIVDGDSIMSSLQSCAYGAHRYDTGHKIVD